MADNKQPENKIIIPKDKEAVPLEKIQASPENTGGGRRMVTESAEGRTMRFNMMITKSKVSESLSDDKKKSPPPEK